MQNGVMLIDGNSLGHFANAGKKMTIGETPVHAIYNFVRTLHKLVVTYPMLTPIVLWDGGSWRIAKFPTYKEIRQKSDTKASVKVQEDKAMYERQRPMIKALVTKLGVTQAEAFNMEADDLAAIFADKYAANGRKVLLVSGDKDWIQLVTKDITWRDIFKKPERDLMIYPSNLEANFGVKSVKEFIEVKAIAGDAGDSVPGVGGVGEKGAIEFVNTYGSFANFLNMWTLEKSVTDAEFKKLPKKYRDLVLDEKKAADFARNMELVDLRTPKRPAPINLRIKQGEPDLAAVRTVFERLLFNSLLVNLEEWLSVFPGFKQERLAA